MMKRKRGAAASRKNFFSLPVIFHPKRWYACSQMRVQSLAVFAKTSRCGVLVRAQACSKVVIEGIGMTSQTYTANAIMRMEIIIRL